MIFVGNIPSGRRHPESARHKSLNNAPQNYYSRKDQQTRCISSFAGSTIEIVFHVDSDNTVLFAGVAIDDVRVFHLGPTAANVPVRGRVISSGGRALGGARVVLADNAGNTRETVTNPFGFYSFENVAAGRSYVLSASLKRYRFNPVVVNVGDEITDLNITANPDE